MLRDHAPQALRRFVEVEPVDHTAKLASKGTMKCSTRLRVSEVRTSPPTPWGGVGDHSRSSDLSARSSASLASASFSVYAVPSVQSFSAHGPPARHLVATWTSNPSSAPSRCPTGCIPKRAGEQGKLSCLFVSRRLTCGAKWLEHLHDTQGVGGSDFSRPTTLTSGNSVLRAGLGP